MLESICQRIGVIRHEAPVRMPVIVSILVIIGQIVHYGSAQSTTTMSSEHLARQERRFYYEERLRYRNDNEIFYDQDDENNELIDFRRPGDIDANVDEIDAENLPKRGLVPHLWPNYTEPEEPEPETVNCNDARLKCAFRAGCGLALQNYALGCADLAAGRTDTCNDHCKHSLIALLSTHEGKRLMKCNCTGDTYCESSKRQIDSCRPDVLFATRPDTNVSCSTAQWICAADPLCSKALEYYNLYCESMFYGKRCSDRCRNSIDILRRQAAAKKLENCFCDGTEGFACEEVKANMDRLCFAPDIESNEVETDASSSTSSTFARFQHTFLIIAVCLSAILDILVEAIRSTLRSGS